MNFETPPERDQYTFWEYRERSKADSLRTHRCPNQCQDACLKWIRQCWPSRDYRRQIWVALPGLYVECAAFCAALLEVLRFPRAFWQ